MEGLGISTLVTAGFHGTFTHIRLNESLECGSARLNNLQPLSIEGKDRFIQRHVTMLKLFVGGNYYVTISAFRGAVRQVCDLSIRSEYFRLDFGNW